MSRKKATVSDEAQALIKAAVSAGLQAGVVHAEHTAADTYKATERRLYAYPVLVQKITEDKARLEDMRTEGMPGKSQSITRFNKTGIRLTAEEMLEAIMTDLQATISTDEHEVKTIAGALQSIADDPYYQTITGRYIKKKSDDDIAAGIPCDPSTVRRNRGRLVRTLAIRLYGASAI